MAMARGVDWWWVAFCAASFSSALLDLWCRRRAGPVLVDLGGSLDRWFSLLVGGVIAAYGLTDIVYARGTTWSALFIVFGMGTGIIAWGTRRCQLREAGIWCAGRLIPWDKIEGYEISAIGALSLKMPGKSLKYCCNVPPALRQQVEDLLASKCQALQPKA